MRNLVTMFDSECRLCRLGIFPHQAGAKGRLTSNVDIPEDAQIHLGHELNAKHPSYRDWQNTQDRVSKIVQPPPMKALEQTEQDLFVYKKRAMFKTFEERLLKLRKIAQEIKEDEEAYAQMCAMYGGGF